MYTQGLILIINPDDSIYLDPYTTDLDYYKSVVGGDFTIIPITENIVALVHDMYDLSQIVLKYNRIATKFCYGDSYYDGIIGPAIIVRFQGGEIKGLRNAEIIGCFVTLYNILHDLKVEQ